MRWTLGFLVGVVLLGAAPGRASADPQSAPVDGPTSITHRRPAWLSGGIVMAGNWSTWMARKQQIDAIWTQRGYALSDEQAEAAYQQEMTPHMADQLKSLGVTLVMLPLWSGMGAYDEEFRRMQDTRRFAAMAHARGMRVGVYIHQGHLSRGFLAARPDAYTWLAWPSFDANYTQPPLPETQDEGYPVYRNHPGYQKFMRSVTDYAVKDVKADWLHFDNYVYGSGTGPEVIADFSSYLHARWTPEQIKARFGTDDARKIVQTAVTGAAPASPAWQRFQTWVLAESYRKLADYARSLNPEIATDVNAGGLHVRFGAPVDPAQLFAHGDAFWDEGAGRGWDARKQLLNTGIRSYKVARLFQQSALAYTPSRLALGESMTFNVDSLGCLYWFLYARLNWAPATNATANDGLMPETRFYLDHRDLFTQGQIVADVAVLRGSSNTLLAPEEASASSYLFEQALIAAHLPFQIIFEQHLDDLKQYRAVVVADVRLLSDEEVRKLVQYAEGGGGLVITDQAASQDEWMTPRPDNLRAFLKAPPSPFGLTVETRGKGRVIYAHVAHPEKFEMGCLPHNRGELIEATTKAMNGAATLAVDAPPFIGTEYLRQPKRILVSLVDYSQASRQPLTITAQVHVVRARLLSPRQEDKVLTVSAAGQGTAIVVPAIDVYGVVVLDLEQ